MNTTLLSEIEVTSNLALEIEVGNEKSALRELQDFELLAVGGGAGDVVLG